MNHNANPNPSHRAPKEQGGTNLDRVEWLSDLVRLEIMLWDRVDTRLRAEHNLSLAFFETLFFLSRSPDERMRVGDLAQAMRITVGGASKLVDRVDAAGLIQRETDATDRRASKIALTSGGKAAFKAAVQTYESDLATLLDAVLSVDEQQAMHRLVKRLLGTLNQETNRTT
jgi:DNA-binding MarR family transcriptional regulator